MAKRYCAACGQQFNPCPQVRAQRFCSDPKCQRERRRRKQAERREMNGSAKISDAQYFRDWAAKNPEYWKRYREEHPDYVEKNRNRQKLRNLAHIAKDNELAPFRLPEGRYQLIQLAGNDIANESVWIVEITVLSGPSSNSGENCKRKP